MIGGTTCSWRIVRTDQGRRRNLGRRLDEDARRPGARESERGDRERPSAARASSRSRHPDTRLRPPLRRACLRGRRRHRMPARVGVLGADREPQEDRRAGACSAQRTRRPSPARSSARSCARRERARRESEVAAHEERDATRALPRRREREIEVGDGRVREDLLQTALSARRDRAARNARRASSRPCRPRARRRAGRTRRAAPPTLRAPALPAIRGGERAAGARRRAPDPSA